MSKRKLYTVTMENGDVWAVPAEVIADNYAKEYESCGEDYQENFDAMMNWFDAKDFEFEDWARNNMDWDDVKDKAFLYKKNEQPVDFQEGWINGECEYVTEEVEN